MKKIKHDHKGTKLLKLGIFASMMLAPLLAIAFKCAYVTFNKNAKDSYSQYVDTITTNVALTDNLINGQTYTINPLSYSATTTTTYYEVLNNQTNIKQLFFPNDTNFNVITKFGMATSGTRTRLIVYNDNNYNNSVFDITSSFYFVSNGVNETNSQSSAWWTISTLSYNTGKLDKAFYYAIDEMKNNELFNWTTNTALYTPTAAMTNGMGITTNTIPILITYWLYLTAIYIVIDIVVELFTALTHMITSKLDT